MFAWNIEGSPSAGAPRLFSGKIGVILLHSSHHGAHVVACSRKTNLADERFTVGCSRAADPFQNISATGVVIRQRVRDWVVCLRVAAEKFFEIPCADQRVRARVDNLFVLEWMNFLRRSPIERRRFADLHQSDFASSASGFRIESCFAPDDRFDQGWFHAVALGCNRNDLVLAVLAPIAPPEIEQQRDKADAAGPKEFLAKFHRAPCNPKRPPSEIQMAKMFPMGLLFTGEVRGAVLISLFKSAVFSFASLK